MDKLNSTHFHRHMRHWLSKWNLQTSRKNYELPREKECRIKKIDRNIAYPLILSDIKQQGHTSFQFSRINRGAATITSFEARSSRKNSDGSLLPLSKLVSQLNNPLPLSESLFRAICDRRNQLSPTDLSKSIRSASASNFDFCIDSLAEVSVKMMPLLKISFLSQEFLHRVASFAPISQTCSVIFALLQADFFCDARRIELIRHLSQYPLRQLNTQAFVDFHVRFNELE